MSAVQHHPFSEIFPPDTDLNFGGQKAENISTVEVQSGFILREDYLGDQGRNYGLEFDDNGQKLRLVGSDLNLSGNKINGFFQTPACPSGKAMVDVNDNGSFQCMNVTEEVSGDYVTRTGDSMTGNLDMTGNSIIGIGDLGGSNIVDSGNINSGAVSTNELNLGDVDSRYVQKSGDSMGGDLDMDGNKITNVGGTQCSAGEALLGDGSCGSISTSLTGGNGINPSSITDGDTLSVAWSDANDLDSNGNVQNSDKIDGEQLQDILNDENTEVSGRDWNTLTEPGIHGVSTSSWSGSNQPTSAYSYGHLIVTEGGGSYGLMQLYVSHHSAENGSFWVRTGWSDGSWDSWRAIPTRQWVNNNDDTIADDQDLPDVVSKGGSINSGQRIDTSSGAFRLPVGADSW